jgi:hypothetical protein
MLVFLAIIAVLVWGKEILPIFGIVGKSKRSNYCG